MNETQRLCLSVDYFTVSFWTCCLRLHFSQANREEKHRDRTAAPSAPAKSIKGIQDIPRALFVVVVVIWLFVYVSFHFTKRVTADKNRSIFCVYKISYCCLVTTWNAFSVDFGQSQLVLIFCTQKCFLLIWFAVKYDKLLLHSINLMNGSLHGFKFFFFSCLG